MLPSKISGRVCYGWFSMLLFLVATLGVGPNAIYAQVDAQQKLREAQRELRRYLVEEAEYNQRTAGHMATALDHLYDTASGLGIELVYGPAAKKIYEHLRDWAQAYMASRRGDSDAVAEIAAKHSLEQMLDQTLEDMLEGLSKKSALRRLSALGEAPGLIDAIFDLLYLWQDGVQRKNLEEQREKALDTVKYWSQRVQGQAQGGPPRRRPPASSDATDSQVKARMQRLGVQVTTPGQAAREGVAQIAAQTRSGYARTDVQIVSRTDRYLALDFSGAYLIPTNTNSGSQRVGLVSVADTERSDYFQRKPFLHLAAYYPPDAGRTGYWPVALQQGRPRAAAWTKKHWIILAPRASVVVPFHSVCLDRNRGTPTSAERFYVSDRPLPPRVQRILIAASLNGDVPQSQVWNTIQQEGITWYDPRDGFPVLHVHGYGAFSQVYSGRLHISADAIEWHEDGGGDDFSVSCSAIREAGRNALLQMGQSFRIRLENKNYNFIPSGRDNIDRILEAIRNACHAQ